MKLIYMGCSLKLETELTFREGYFPSVLLALFWSDVEHHFENAPFVGPATPRTAPPSRPGKLPSPATRETTRRPAPRKRARLRTSGKRVSSLVGQAPSGGTRVGAAGRWALGTGRAAPTRGGGERDLRSGARGPGPGGREGSAGRDARRSGFSGSEDRVSPEVRSPRSPSKLHPTFAFANHFISL